MILLTVILSFWGGAYNINTSSVIALIRCERVIFHIRETLSIKAEMYAGVSLIKLLHM